MRNNYWSHWTIPSVLVDGPVQFIQKIISIAKIFVDLPHCNDWWIIGTVWEQSVDRSPWIVHIDWLQFSVSRWRHSSTCSISYENLPEFVLRFFRSLMVEYFVHDSSIYSAIIFLFREYRYTNISPTFHRDHRKSIYTNRTTTKKNIEFSRWNQINLLLLTPDWSMKHHPHDFQSNHLESNKMNRQDRMEDLPSNLPISTRRRIRRLSFNSKDKKRFSSSKMKIFHLYTQFFEMNGILNLIFRISGYHGCYPRMYWFARNTWYKPKTAQSDRLNESQCT